MFRPDKPNMHRRFVLVVLLAMGATGCTSGAPPPTADRALALARLAELPEGAVVFNGTHRVYVVNSPAEGLLGLADIDPFRGCRIAHLGKPEFRADNPLVSFDDTRFVDPCHGSEYDISGLYLGGPSPRSMDRVAVDVVGDWVVLAGDGVIEVPHPGD